MGQYLLWPRRNRFATNPVGTALDYVPPSNARINLTLLNTVSNPVQVSQVAIGPTPVNDAEGETLIGIVANPVAVARAYAKKTNPVMVTIASPGVFTYTAHGFAANQIVFLTTTGALPTGLNENRSP